MYVDVNCMLITLIIVIGVQDHFILFFTLGGGGEGRPGDVSYPNIFSEFGP